MFLATFAAFLLAMLASREARADFSISGVVSANSVSGQFSVMGRPDFSPLSDVPEVITNQDIIRLKPALLAVSAERVKESILRKLGADPYQMWGGTIYLTLQPARSLDENVAVFPGRFNGRWVYHVVLPDVLPKEQLVRALTSVFLSDYANRNAGDHVADVPAWLVEGLSQDVLAENLHEIILSAPDQIVDGMPIDRVSLTEHGEDPLVRNRPILEQYSILTFQQLSWPSDLQLSGEDGGVFRASAQLFVECLLGQRNGPAQLRAMLDDLPRFYNWQSAFLSAFHEKFYNPLQVEKWWALRTVIFAAHSPGPRWTLPESRERLDEILSVAVQFRSTTNSLPARADISLQEVIQNFDSAEQLQILQLKLRDLETAQFRMDASLAVLTAEYRDALAGYLGISPITRRAVLSNKVGSRIVSAHDTLRVLDTLDARRRALALAPGPGLPE